MALLHLIEAFLQCIHSRGVNRGGGGGGGGGVWAPCYILRIPLSKDGPQLKNIITNPSVDCKYENGQILPVKYGVVGKQYPSISV